jgi:hypothetical protein
VSGDGGRRLRKFSDQPADDLLAAALQYRRWHTSSCLWRYPDKRLAHWAPFYQGEDLVHDVSVGVHWRRAVLLPETLTLAKHAGGQISSEVSRERRRGAIEVPLMVEGMLRESGLHENPKYAEPLAERFYYLGFLQSKRNLFEESQRAFKHAIRLSQSRVKRVEAKMGMGAVKLFKGRSRLPLRLLFRLHKAIVPVEVHCQRNFR